MIIIDEIVKIILFLLNYSIILINLSNKLLNNNFKLGRY